jgi:preprotein translocase subunit SecE
MTEKIKQFLIESRQELKRVNWPRKEETIRYTVFVIALSLGLAVLLGILDYVFVQGLQKMLF